jgi:aspartyl-tRNA(Asn)/glutamyl-tRNA(Gln) amidotransferase subunit A
MKHHSRRGERGQSVVEFALVSLPLFLVLLGIIQFGFIFNAYVTVTADQALAEAKIAEQEIGQNGYRGPLHGIPVSIKDNIATRGVRTTAGSKILSDWIPEFDAFVVSKLRAAGAVLLGKTNMHEWALGGTTINPYYGTTCNPWDITRIAGGSSGGSGAAIAASMSLASVGTDSAQSVRNPAAMCGVVGLKPTYGRISQSGMVPGTGGFSTNHIGILTKTVEDCALVLQAVAGHDPNDPLSAEQPVPVYSKAIGSQVRGTKVGILRGYFDEVITSEVRKSFLEAMDVLRSLGMEVEEVSTPSLDVMPAVKVCTSRVENAIAHDTNLRTRPRDYSDQVLYSYIGALLVPAATYLTAQRVRRILCEEFDELLRRFEILALPTVPFPAPTIQECKSGFLDIDGKKVKRQDERGGVDSLCAIPFNVTGHPALSICCGFSSRGLPIGMQLATRRFAEETLFAVAHSYEQATLWNKMRPPLD